jgi:5-formyltetrahydrofolate cyclo-ligase
LDEERKTLSLAIAERFFEILSSLNIRVLHVFLPIEKNREIDTSLVYKRLWKDFPEIVTIVSRVNFLTMTLENLKFDSRTNLVKNKWHILEPTENELFEIERIDAVLVPLLCLTAEAFASVTAKVFTTSF